MSIWTYLFGKPPAPDMSASELRTMIVDHGAANLWMASFRTHVQHGFSRNEPNLAGITKMRNKMPLMRALATAYRDKVDASLAAGYWSTIIAVPGYAPRTANDFQDRLCFNLLMVTNDPDHAEPAPHIEVNPWLISSVFKANATWPYVVVVAGTSRFNYYVGDVHSDADAGHAGLVAQMSRLDGKRMVHARYIGTVL